MNVLVSGGAGFVGSHVAEYYARKGRRVTVLDNLSRGETLPTADRSDAAVSYNWQYLSRFSNVRLVKGDVRDADLVDRLVSEADAVVHLAAQVAVTSSLEDPRHDFEVNLQGTLNVLEAARRSSGNPALVYASTNKVYGDNVNRIPVRDAGTRYAFADPAYASGIPETLSTDGCEHTPYGVSKLGADLYVQDYAHTYGLRTGVFRMSCIYGPRQFGNEDQGWVAHFVLSLLRGRPITVYGDGKQVRDLLYGTDLVAAYDAFLHSRVRHGVWNAGGGPANTASLLEFLDLAEELTGRPREVSFDAWRPGDQKVYVSDVRALRTDLSWEPRVGIREGLERLVGWARDLPGLVAPVPR